mgnify:CR=1 FL=1
MLRVLSAFVSTFVPRSARSFHDFRPRSRFPSTFTISVHDFRPRQEETWSDLQEGTFLLVNNTRSPCCVSDRLSSSISIHVPWSFHDIDIDPRCVEFPRYRSTISFHDSISSRRGSVLFVYLILLTEAVEEPNRGSNSKDNNKSLY